MKHIKEYNSYGSYPDISEIVTYIDNVADNLNLLKIEGDMTIKDSSLFNWAQLVDKMQRRTPVNSDGLYGYFVEGKVYPQYDGFVPMRTKIIFKSEIIYGGTAKEPTTEFKNEKEFEKNIQWLRDILEHNYFTSDQIKGSGMVFGFVNDILQFNGPYVFLNYNMSLVREKLIR